MNDRRVGYFYDEELSASPPSGIGALCCSWQECWLRAGLCRLLCLKESLIFSDKLAEKCASKFEYVEGLTPVPMTGDAAHE